MPESPTETFDVGKRAADWYNLHVAALHAQRKSMADPWPRRYIAIRLSDGGSDGEIYDTREDAIRHQVHEQFCAYFYLVPDGITSEDALRFIMLNRELYQRGYRLADPDMPGEPIYPNRIEDILQILGREN